MHFLRQTLLVISAALWFSACSPTSNVQTHQPTQDISPTQSICDHLYWPIRNGAVWNYQYMDSTGVSQSLELSNTIEPSGAQIMIGDVPSAFSCIDGAIIGVPTGLIGSAYPSLNRIMGDNARGAWLPSPDILSIGSSWDLEADAKGVLILDGELLPILSGKVIISSLPFPIEPITISQDSFSALPIQQTVYYELTIQGADGSQQPVLINLLMQSYFVEGIGLARMNFLGGVMSSASGNLNRTLEGGASLELVTFAIP